MGKMLHVSGGALVLNKCFWIGLFWKFENGLPRAAKIKEMPWEIHLTSSYSTERQLNQRYEANEGRRTLGAWLAGVGDNRDMMKVMMERGQMYRCNLAAVPLTCGEGYQAYDSIISKAMAYPLCVMTFTKAECVKIQTTYMSMALQKMGFMRTTKRALVFGPEEYGGLRITDLWMEQGIQHVSLLIGHLRNGGEAGTLLALSIEWMVLMIG
jgi:hypothetical protein